MTDDREEWGPWIDHDGSAKPLPRGMWVNVEFRAEPGPFEENPFEGGGWSQDIAWHWTDENDDVVRYRVRKPRALRDLIRLSEDIPQQERIDA
ncbi:hypothetical protein ACGYLO_16515 [Sulfitobacter sp. 1A13353]|uniref:hypothetical protein n=1 Tax=Sulfitobacter sp. 1A13353 TaxID=3368568 RepID=UPI0037468CCD